MLSPVPALLAHAGEPLAAHDLWARWDAGALLLVGAAAVALLAAHRAAARPRHSGRRFRSAVLGLLALAAALASPLDALAGELASAHMVQHIVLVLVAAPLLAMGAPMRSLLAAAPRDVRVLLARASRRRSVTAVAAAARQPAVVWLLHAGALWAWHSSLLYDAALRHRSLHVVEHVSFLATALLFWDLVLGPSPSRRLSGPAGALLVFTVALQSVFLSALLTFARAPWYQAYSESAPRWGIDPLTDQQIAGLVMWIPAGLVYLAVTLGVLLTWLERTEREAEGPSQAAALAGGDAPSRA